MPYVLVHLSCQFLVAKDNKKIGDIPSHCVDLYLIKYFGTRNSGPLFLAPAEGWWSRATSICHLDTCEGPLGAHHAQNYI